MVPLLAQQCTLEFNLSTKTIIITSYCAERKKEKKQGSVKVKEFGLTGPRDKKSILIGYGLMDKRSYRDFRLLRSLSHTSERQCNNKKC